MKFLTFFSSTGVFGDNAKITGIPPEVWRYYLLAVRPEQSDTDFKWDDFAAKTNNELLANLGNLVNRVLMFIHSKYKTIPEPNDLKDIDSEILSIFHRKINEYCQALEVQRLKDALKIVMEASSEANRYFQETEPWVLIKSDPER